MLRESATRSSPRHETHCCHYTCECGALKDFGCEQVYDHHLYMLCLPVRCDRYTKCEQKPPEDAFRHVAPPAEGAIDFRRGRIL
jgi:hypothetical protein